MRGHRPELADVFRSYGPIFERSLGPSTSIGQRRVLRDIAVCRTRALGGHKRRCDRCGHEQIAYNSCRNRHCPKCQAAARARWLEAREQELLEVPYFHVVFTLPESLGPLALQNKRELYGTLFRAAAETLQTLGRDPKHLGAELGFVAILHTWGQTLQHHPHLHCVVPGGGISPDGQRWVASRPGFFFPVRVMSRLFRGRFLAHLQRAFDQRKLQFHGQLSGLREAQAWQRWLRYLRSSPWVVYAKPPFGGARQVLKYLARYTHRVAISNNRLKSIDGGKVTFRWKDYARGNQQRTMTLDGVEFIRRFLLHVLPRGFVRIRHYGFMANRDRGHRLRVVHALVEHSAANTPPPNSAGVDPTPCEYGCPRCQRGRLVVVETLEPQAPSDQPWPLDTS